MTYKSLDVVVLDRDIPERGLRRGDLGAVVEVYPPDGLTLPPSSAQERTLASLRAAQPIRWADLLARELGWAFDVTDVEEDCEE